MIKTTLAGLRAHKLRLLLTSVAIVLGVGFISGTFVLTDTLQAGVTEKFGAPPTAWTWSSGRGTRPPRAAGGRC